MQITEIYPYGYTEITPIFFRNCKRFKNWILHIYRGYMTR
nr:MAG TPA: hypothetical protein [Caudoviricetes sp.]